MKTGFDIFKSYEPPNLPMNLGFMTTLDRWNNICDTVDDHVMLNYYFVNMSQMYIRLFSGVSFTTLKEKLDVVKEISFIDHPICDDDFKSFYELLTGRSPERATQSQKGIYLTQSYDKSPYTHRKIQKATWPHKKRHQNFDYRTIADRLRTVSWSNNSHPSGMVKAVYGLPTIPITATAVKSKGHIFKKL